MSIFSKLINKIQGIGVTPTKFPLKRFWSWGALLSIAFFIPLVNIPAYLLLNGKYRKKTRCTWLDRA
jgi:hypothetical protein